MGLKDRLIEFINYKNVDKSVFERNCGLSNDAVNKMGENTRMSTLNKILDYYPDLNIVWLRTGEGEMTIKKNTNDCSAQVKENNLLEVHSKLDELKHLFNELADIKHKKQNLKESYLADISINEDEIIDESSLTISKVYEFVLKQNRVILNLNQELEELRQVVSEIKQGRKDAFF